MVWYSCDCAQAVHSTHEGVGMANS
jgi:hypothetical protein